MDQNLVPAQVWLGDKSVLKSGVVKYLQEQFCQQSGCGSCADCTKLAQKTYHNLLWLEPVGQYKLDQMKDILQRMSMMLAQDEKFFFVLEEAQCLSIACANSLLKSIEEPSAGYNFIFLAQRKEQLLPTITSRCTLKSFYQDGDDQSGSELYKVFTGTRKVNPVEFAKVLDQEGINEYETSTLVDLIYKFWMQKYRAAFRKGEDTAKIERVISKIRDVLMVPPMPGSSKLFWKNFFMSVNGML